MWGFRCKWIHTSSPLVSSILSLSLFFFFWSASEHTKQTDRKAIWSFSCGKNINGIVWDVWLCFSISARCSSIITLSWKQSVIPSQRSNVKPYQKLWASASCWAEIMLLILTPTLYFLGSPVCIVLAPSLLPSTPNLNAANSRCTVHSGVARIL